MRSHSIIHYLRIAAVFVTIICLSMIVSEVVLGSMQKSETSTLEANVDTMNEYMRSVQDFLTDYSRFLIDREPAHHNSLHSYWDEMQSIRVSSRAIFDSTDLLTLYSRVIDQTAESLIGIMDRLSGLHVFSESDFELNQLAELGIDYIYQASNAVSAEYFTYVSHELTKVNDKYNRYGNIQDIILTICLPLALIGIAWLFRSLVGGLAVINAATERISRKEWDTPDIELTRINELNQVIEATNLMKKTIVDYVGALEEHMKVSNLLAERTLESERQKRIIQETQFHLLQAQINPHFLFNTLNLIVNNVRAGVRLKETADVLVSTSKLLRSSIELKSKVIPLRDELRLLDNYITIQKVRNEDRIVFCIIVGGDIPDVEVPPFTLQPLVENSILHGLKDMTADGYVEIQIFSDEDDGAMIQIHDNGTGIPEEIEKAAVAGTLSSNGLGNVVNRLKMVYSNEDIIRFSKTGVGSTTIIHLDASKRRPIEC